MKNLKNKKRIFIGVGLSFILILVLQIFVFEKMEDGYFSTIFILGLEVCLMIFMTFFMNKILKSVNSNKVFVYESNKKKDKNKKTIDDLFKKMYNQIGDDIYTLIDKIDGITIEDNKIKITKDVTSCIALLLFHYEKDFGKKVDIIKTNEKQKK